MQVWVSCEDEKEAIFWQIWQEQVGDRQANWQLWQQQVGEECISGAGHT